MLAAIAVTATAVTTAVLHGAFHRNSPVFGAALGRLPTRERQVALTFDDGPNPRATPEILDVLDAEGVKATFFLLGKHVERWPGIASQVARRGHQLGNHGYHHRKLHARGPAYVRLDLALGTDAISQATDARPRFFRAPHGFRSPWVAGIARSLDQRIVGWTLGVWDSDRPGTEEIRMRAIEGVSPGCILLLHDGDGYDPEGDRSQTVRALSGIIRDLRDRGYQFVTLPH